jgi:hypothetical protein
MGGIGSSLGHLGVSNNAQMMGGSASGSVVGSNTNTSNNNQNNNLDGTTTKVDETIL